MKNLVDLAQAIDCASDSGDESQLRELGEKCETWLRGATGVDRVILLYYQSNTYGGIVSSQVSDSNARWDWEQSDAIQTVLLLRQAISEPSFGAIDSILSCQIRTNLANRLYALGRPLAANELWLKVLETEPCFAKALVNRGEALGFFATTLYDKGHEILLLAAARTLFDSALHEDALWESGDRDSFVAGLKEKGDRIDAYLVDSDYDEDYDLNQWPMGSTEEERAYRQWCLRLRLFLNPINEAYTKSVAATDVLHLPDHTYSIEESPRFPAYYNLLKQEYVSARYRLYHAIHENDPDFLMSEVIMLDSGEGQALGHYTEDLKAAFRAAYSIFDKIGLFLSDYYQLGLEVRRVSFRSVWSEKSKGGLQVRPLFKDRRNWFLRGLYFLSKDLFDENFEEVAEPDAAELASLRNQAEHRFLSLQHGERGVSDDTNRLITLEDFQRRIFRVLRMAREALIYLSLAMHREETLRVEARGNESRMSGTLVPRRIEAFQRPEDSARP